MIAAGFFRAVEPTAPVFPLLERLRPAVEAEVERYDGTPATVQAELRTRRGPGGELELDRFYWSTQQRDEGSRLGLRARTLYCRGGVSEPQLFEFPADPAMPWLDQAESPLHQDARSGRLEVLRYIPLRRVTYRLTGAAGLPASVIAKVKRESGLRRAARALTAVGEAARRRGDDVPTVPRLLRAEPDRHVVYLDDLPGGPLAAAVRTLDTTETMLRLGALQSRLQRLEVDGLPVRHTADWLADARRAAELIGLFVPSAADRAEAVFRDLERTAPAESRLVFCQGDFLPSQVLCHPSGWSVIDLDDSRYADPLTDVAAMYAAMPRELDLPVEDTDRARAVYLEAYAASAGEPVDDGRWHWFLVLHRLNELAKRLTKGRADGAEVRTVLDRLTAPSGDHAD